MAPPNQVVSPLLLIAVAVSLAASMAMLSRRNRRDEQRSRKKNQKEKRWSASETWVQESILDSMPPAVKLGIGVQEVKEDGSTLSLSMPLEGNTNIHGTAFAGSLYSLAALSAWYTLTHYLRDNNVLETYAVVLKSATISYKLPVRTDHIVAKSQLPLQPELHRFWKDLEDKGKTVIEIIGSIGHDGKTSVEYSALLCAFRAKN